MQISTLFNLLSVTGSGKMKNKYTKTTAVTGLFNWHDDGSLVL